MAQQAAHEWIGAALVTLPSNIVKQADQRGTVRLPKDTKIQVLEVYCKQCRRPHESVAGKPCEALGSREHLIGGPIGTRRRKITEEDGPQHAAL